ncbi:MAG: hypothetical protein WCQ21_15915 [Verrucomicrobiota bacterium]|jgi:hypothetical protein
MNTDPTPNPTAAPPTLVPGTHCELMVLVSTLTRQFPQGDIYAILAEALLHTVDTRLSLCEAIREELLEVVCRMDAQPPSEPQLPSQQ